MHRTFQLILIALLVKLVYFIFALVVSASTNHSLDVAYSYDGFTKTLYRNDAGWYEKISKEGYPRIKNQVAIGFHYKTVFIQSSWAFFPFYPFMNYIIMKTINCRYNTSALIISILFSILAFTGFYRFNLIYLKDERIAYFNTLLLIFLPFNYFFSVFYTEAVFFSILIFCFLSIYYKKLWILFLLLIPLTLTRPNGLAMVVPLFLYYLERNNLFVLRVHDFHAEIHFRYFPFNYFFGRNSISLSI